MACGQSVLHETVCALCGRRCREGTIQGIAQELHLDWIRSKRSTSNTCVHSWRKPGRPGPGPSALTRFRSARPYLPHRGQRSDSPPSDMVRWRGSFRSEHDSVLRLAGDKKSRRIRLAVMDMWKPFRKAAMARAPQAAVLFDKFHIMRHLGEALDQVRKSEYARLSGADRRYIKGQKYTAALASGKSDSGGQASAPHTAGRQQALEHGVSTQRILRSTLGLQT